MNGKSDVYLNETIKIATRNYYVDHNSQVASFADTVYLKLIIGDAIADFDYVKNDTEVNFTAKAKKATSYSWDFGDGNTSTLTNPSHIYQTTGDYNVCLTITSNCGTRNICKQINVTCSPPTAGFVNYGNYYNSFNLSFNTYLTSSNNPITDYYWKFSDGTTGNGPKPSKTFQQIGDYEVCLTVTNECGAKDIMCDTVTITCVPPIAKIIDSITGTEVYFSDWSLHHDNWNTATSFWDFGDGNTSTERHPIHEFANYGTYQVCLISTNSCGSDTTCKTVISECKKPYADFNYASEDNNMVFHNESQSNSDVTYDWDFGDGNNSTQAYPTHKYSNFGSYNVCLIATNKCGSDTVCSNITTVCSVPNANLYFSKNDKNVSFSSATTSNSTATYNWDFGDGNTSTEQHPIHDFTSPGNYTICLIATNECGKDTICKSVEIDCPEISNDLTLQINIDQQVTFSNTDPWDLDAFTYSWDFGDGNTSNADFGKHTYQTAGTYEICLTTEKEGCEVKNCKSVEIVCAKPVAYFNSYLNNDKAASFNINQSYQHGEREHYWDFGDGESNYGESVYHQFPTEGTFNVCLTISNVCASDTFCKDINVTCDSIIVDIRDTLAYETTVNFNNAQYSAGDYYWEFGDGNTSTEKWPRHTYANAGTYTACLTITNSCGSVQSCKEINVSTLTSSQDVTHNHYSVFPNPISNKVSIEFDNLTSGLMEIMNLEGKVVKSEWFDETNSLSYPVDLISGIYILKITSDGQQHQQKLIVR